MCCPQRKTWLNQTLVSDVFSARFQHVALIIKGGRKAFYVGAHQPKQRVSSFAHCVAVYWSLWGNCLVYCHLLSGGQRSGSVTVQEEPCSCLKGLGARVQKHLQCRPLPDLKAIYMFIFWDLCITDPKNKITSFASVHGIWVRNCFLFEDEKKKFYYKYYIIRPMKRFWCDYCGK